MLPPDKSPIHKLVALWITCRLPGKLEVNACRARLYEAATHEITAMANDGSIYDPLMDYRFRWAAQWLDVADGSRKTIDENVQFLVNSHFSPPLPLDHKSIASGETAA